MDGLKITLDNLIHELSIVFDAILVTRKRLLLHPLLTGNEVLEKVFPKKFGAIYGELLMNQRLRQEVPVLEQIWNLYGGRSGSEGVVLTYSTPVSNCCRILQQVISDLELLSMIG